VPRIYTKTGDDGTTGLLYGGRVAKTAPSIELNGAVDEAQAALGVVRADAPAGSELAELVVAVERDLWVLMAEVATAPGRRDRLVPEATLVTEAMVERLERHIDDLAGRFTMPSEFVVPGANRTAALLDVARTVVRRAERCAVAHPPDPTSLVGRYLNRLSDLLWAMARWQEGEDQLPTRSA
jgi:cob(I)alamin adenosyltransferase